MLSRPPREKIEVRCCLGGARAEGVHQTNQLAEGFGRVDSHHRWFLWHDTAVGVGPRPRYPHSGAVGQANDEQGLPLLDEVFELSIPKGMMPSRDLHALWRITKDIRSL